MKDSTNFLRQRRKASPKPNLGALGRYESLKAVWVAEHPEATPATYQAAMNAICKRCGV